MRSDMFKVIVERPRRGHSCKNPHVRKMRRTCVTEEDSGGNIPMRPQGRIAERKELNENLNPLERFLDSKVGETWDDVYSEICEGLSLDSTVQRHVRQHLKDWVCTSLFDKDLDNLWWKYRVDEHGILQKNDHNRKQWYKSLYSQQSDPDKREIDGVKYERSDGVWYELLITETHIMERYLLPAWPKIVGQPTWGVRPAVITTIKRRQLSTKELVKLGFRSK